MGAHKNPRRKLSQTEEAFARQEKAAEELSIDWSEFAREALEARADEILNPDND